MRDRSGPDASRSGAALAPRARVTDLVITEAAGEVLVYDQVTHHIHHLNRMSVVVWRLCDGRRTADDLVRLARMKLGGDVDRLAVRLALTKLDEARLLDGPLDRELRLSGHVAAVAGETGGGGNGDPGGRLDLSAEPCNGHFPLCQSGYGSDWHRL